MSLIASSITTALFAVFGIHMDLILAKNAWVTITERAVLGND